MRSGAFLRGTGRHGLLWCLSLLVISVIWMAPGLLVPSAGAVVYPFSDDMEDTASGNWIFEGNWGYTEEIAAHSGTHSITESPDGVYTPDSNTSATLASSLDLTSAVKPMLRFWQVYSLEQWNDMGYVEVSGDGGSSWRALTYVTGVQSDWTKMEVDLTEYAGNGNVMIRFRLAANYSVAYDGWHIDDVAVLETDATAIPYPFLDNVETPSVSEGQWHSSVWKVTPGGVNGSGYSWSSLGGNYTFCALTLANVVDLRSAVHPVLSFWHRGSGYGYVEVSNFNGNAGSWQSVGYYYPQSEWVQEQIDLSAYEDLGNVRVRFINESWNGSDWQVDDIRLEDTPRPHGSIQVSNATLHGAHLSWDQYPWTVGKSFAAFSHYEVYRSTSSSVSRTNGDLVCRITDVTQTQYDDGCETPAYSVIQPDFYYYRVYVVDSNGLYSAGSLPAKAIYSVPTVSYPFYDSMEGGTGSWGWNCPWGLTNTDAHTGSYSWSTNPEGGCPNNANTAITFRISLLTATKPMLRFWQTYGMEQWGDMGYVEVSGDAGANWKGLAYVTGVQSDWTKMEVDLTEYAGNGNVVIRFRLATNASVAYDGWRIDDVAVLETDATATPYPFLDNVETPSVSEGQWHSSVWKVTPGGVNGSGYSWSSLGGNYTFCALTLANVVDLRSAVHPVLSFWHRGSGYGYVEVSNFNGNAGSWQSVGYYYPQSEWVQEQIDLSAYEDLGNVRVRFINESWNGSDWQVDDIRLEDTPRPHGSIQVSNATLHGAHLSWDQYPWTVGKSFAAFSHYEVYRSTSPSVSRTNGDLVCRITDVTQTQYDDGCETPAYSVIQPNFYYYRMYVVDSNGLYSAGSLPAQAVYSIPTVSYPFSDSMEFGTGAWGWNCPWGLASGDAHTGSYSWSTNPEGGCPNNANTALTFRISLLSATKPVLRFWQTYGLEQWGDMGYVEVSGDAGTTWKALAYVTGVQSDWTKMEVDLTEYAGNGNVVIRFRLATNASVAYDGWRIDDVAVLETDGAAVPYPFLDNVENPTVSQTQWLSSSWKVTSGGVNGSGYSWHSFGGNYTFCALTLANVVDLRSAVSPVLSFWHRGSGYGYVEVSNFNGNAGSWQSMGYYYPQDEWVQEQIDLSAYANVKNVRVRFVNEGGNGSDWQIDDISITGQDPPSPAGYALATDFGSGGTCAGGFWLFHGDAWSELTSLSPDKTATYNYRLAADFPGYGLYEYYPSDGTWTQLTAAGGLEDMIGIGFRLYADYGTAGLWVYDGGWTNITSANPDRIVAFGNKLAASFPGYGLFLYDGANWTMITPVSAVEGMIGVGDSLYVDFGSFGLYRFDGDWDRLTTSNPGELTISGNKVVASFPGLGIYQHDGFAWTLLTDVTTLDSMIGISDVLYIDFGLAGLWKHEGGSWSELTTHSPAFMTSFGGNLATNFSSFGLWVYNGTTEWSELTPSTCATAAIAVPLQ